MSSERDASRLPGSPEWLDESALPRARGARKASRKTPRATTTGDRDSPGSSTPPRRSGRELSAGGVVVRGDQVLVIVPSKRAADGSPALALPKGHIDEGESRVQAATREVREETGVTAEPLIELGEVRYWYVRRGHRIPKSVFFYLFRYLSGDPSEHDEEVLEARWMPLEQAQRELTYAGEREMAGRALAMNAQDR
jgi:8-oxo-dGTP pyrophosphatase MutT (NUDIX family)